MAWLTAEGETPRRFPARVKLRSSRDGEEHGQFTEVIAFHL
jgi:hypothetical protein